MESIKKNYNYLLFSFYLLSILFWFFEIGYSLVFRDKFVLPGTWYGPYCPIYGLTFLVMYTVFKKENPIVINMAKTAVTVTLLEYFVSYITQIIFHRRIWNYSKKMFNINGRICLEMSLLFTIIGIITMYFVEPLIRKLYDKIGNKVKYINISLSIILLFDIIVNIINRG